MEFERQYTVALLSNVGCKSLSLLAKYDHGHYQYSSCIMFSVKNEYYRALAKLILVQDRFRIHETFENCFQITDIIIDEYFGQDETTIRTCAAGGYTYTCVCVQGI